jgi:FkbM family methyltransferase
VPADRDVRVTSPLLDGSDASGTLDAGSEAWRLFEFVGGFRCYSHGSFEETTFIYNETFLQEDYMRCGVELSDGDCVFDVGANIGLFAIYANRRCKELRTFAFEPMEPTYQVLLQNLRLHGLEQVLALPFGLGAPHDRTKEFTYYPNMPGNSTTRPDTKAIHRSGMQVTHAAWQVALAFESVSVTAPVRTLSSVIEEYDVRRIDLLKIDVEGGEEDVLAGIAPHHWERIRQIVLEVHGAAAYLAHITGLLGARGFRVSSRTSVLDTAGNMNVYCVRSGVG